MITARNARGRDFASPVASTDAATKGYVDAGDALGVLVAGHAANSVPARAGSTSGPLADVAAAVSTIFGRSGSGDLGHQQLTADQVASLPFGAIATALAAATSDVSINGHKLTNLATPTAGTDAASKTYVDALVLGLDVKPSAAALAVAAVGTLSGLATTADGVALSVDGMRVVLTAESSAVNNGPWLVHSGAWTRPADFAAGSSAAGAFTFIEGGTVYSDTGWVCTANAGSDVVGTNNLPWVQFSAAGVMSVTGGLTKTGNVISVANADGTLVVTAGDVRRAAITGDVSISTGSNVATITAHAVTVGKLQQAPGASLMVVTGSPGDPSADFSVLTGTTNAQYVGIRASTGIGFYGIVANDLPSTVTGARLLTTRDETAVFNNSVSLAAAGAGVLQQTVGGSPSTANVSAVSIGAGRVAFGATSGGGLATDSVIAVDATNHRLGVGTASPSYTLEVLGMTRHSGATGINANPDAEAAMYLQTQITGDRDRVRFRIGGAGTALPTTGTPVGYVKWSPASTTIASGATVAALFTHEFEQQTFSLGTGATVTDAAPATVTIKNAPNFVGAGTAPANPRALRVEAGDISVDSGTVFAFQFMTNSGSANTTISPDSSQFGGSVEIIDDLIVDRDLHVGRDVFFAKGLGTWGHGGFASQPTVTGSRGGNAALANLLSTLATYGLIIDGST